MPIALQAFTTPANTTVISDTAAAPGTLPTPAVPAITVPATAPLIDGNQNYIWSPNNASGQTVTFRSVFNIPAPLFNLLLPVSGTYAFAGNETVSITGRIQVLDVLGIIVLDIPFLTPASNNGEPNNVSITFGEALIAASVLGTSIRFIVDATVTAPVTLPYAPANTGRYLGQLTIQTII